MALTRTLVGLGSDMSQAFLAGSLATLKHFSESVLTRAPRLFRLGRERMAMMSVEKYLVVISGSPLEPDEQLVVQVGSRGENHGAAR